MSNNKNKATKEDLNPNANKGQESDTNHKLPDTPNDEYNENISTADDTSNGKYSKTNVRKEDKDLDAVRGNLNQ